MADLMEQGADFLASQQKAHASKSVVYSRSGFGAVQVDATLGRTEFEQTDENGLVLRTESRDFIVVTDDLTIAGAKLTPTDGDEVIETVGGQTLVFKVMAPGGGQPWRHTDQYRKALRIHTKHVRTG